MTGGFGGNDIAVDLVLLSLAVVSVLLSLVVNYIVLSCRTYFSFTCHKLYCGFAVVYDYSCIFCLFWRLCVQEAAKKDCSKKNFYIHRLTDKYKRLYYVGPRVRPAPRPRGPIYSSVTRKRIYWSMLHHQRIYC
jgi:hypothetical protein